MMMAFQDEKSSSEINDGRDVGLKQMLKTSNMCMSEIVIKCPDVGEVNDQEMRLI